MHMAIDILAGIILLFFFLKGWHRGFLLSLLGVVRGVACFGSAYFAGRHIGYWFGAATHRPRLITIPVVALATFVLVAFAFHIVMHKIRARHHKEQEKEKPFQRPLPSGLAGGAISLVAGTFSLVLLFWLGDLFFLGVAGTPVPGAERANFGRLSRRVVYELAFVVIPKQDHETQVSAMARMISNPGKGLDHLEKIFQAHSVKQLLSDKEFAKDLLCGDAKQIEQNASLQQLFNDRATLDEFRELGLLSGYETKSGLCRKLARAAHNEKIHASIENLRAKQLLTADQLHRLIRDPDFDLIIAELVK